jgi:hypothetical protein
LKTLETEAVYSPQMITLIVGEGDDAKSFSIHQDILCNSSAFFKAACKPQWMKADERVITFPDDDPVALQGMVYWMKHKEIRVPAGLEATLVRSEQQWGFFIKLYVLGDKYLVPKLVNDAIDSILIMREGRYLALANVSYAYLNTMPGSHLRSLIADMVACEIHLDDFEDWELTFCPEFLLDVAKSCMRHKHDTAKAARVICLEETFCATYHSHGKGRQQSCKQRKFYSYETTTEMIVD